MTQPFPKMTSTKIFDSCGISIFHTKLTHFITTEHVKVNENRKLAEVNRKWLDMTVRQFSNFEHFVKPNMFFVCFNEVCVFSNPSGEHAFGIILESLVSGMLWFQPLTFIQNGSKLVTLLEF